jgi:N-acetylmuramoyl-L-alanine amidase
MMGFKVFIDPGHGGEDPGATASPGNKIVREADLNLAVGKMLRNELRQAKVSTSISREDDVFISLHDRAVDANAWHADVFISIHCNAGLNAKAKGISTHIHPDCSKDTRALAKCIQGSLVKAFRNHTNRGTEQNNFQVLRDTRMPAVLVECEFMTNPEGLQFLRDPSSQLALARAIAQGIKTYAERRV